jgi:hypothetical protein
MSTQPLDYSAFLSDLEAKKAAIEAAIASLRSVMALGALAIGQGGDLPAVAGSASSISIHNGEVPNGAFLGKSIPEAAKFYLEIIKRKQTTREIAEALQRGGMESTSRNFVGIVHAVLDRARKSPNPAIVRIGTQWGLAGWYPKGILSGASSTPSLKERIRRAKKAKAQKTKASAQQKLLPAIAEEPKEVSNETPAKSDGAFQRVAQLLQSTPIAEFSGEEVASHCGLHKQVAFMLLGRLVKDQKAEKTADGKYRSVN